jgi:hypothetical protein
MLAGYLPCAWLGPQNRLPDCSPISPGQDSTRASLEASRRAALDQWVTLLSVRAAMSQPAVRGSLHEIDAGCRRLQAPQENRA